MSTLSIAILVSGNGSVLRTLLRVCNEGSLDGAVVSVASNQECPALAVAREAGTETVRAFPTADHASRADRDAALGHFVAGSGADIVVVGGYSEPLEEEFFAAAPPNVISMYPALLPAFGELDEAIGPALEAGVKQIGVTIHFRAPRSVSAGPIIAQRPLAVDLDDTVDSVTRRVIELESEFLPSVMSLFAAGKIRREGAVVRILSGA